MQATKRALLLYALGVPVALAFVLWREDLWPLGAAFLGAALLLTAADAWLCPSSNALHVVTKPPPTIYVGTEGVLEVKLLPAGLRTALRGEAVCDFGTNLAPAPPRRLDVRPGQAEDFTVPLRPLRRGLARIDRLWLRWPGPLGLVMRIATRPLQVDVPVVPNIGAVKDAALRFSARDALFGIKVQYQQGTGSEFDALRDYMPGFDHRSIDWKHSARHRKLVCKEYRTERNHQIVLAIDTGQLMSEPIDGIPKIDHAINAALMLSYFSLRSGDQVGLVGFDARVRKYLPPQAGAHTFPRLQRAFADLDYHSEETNFTLALADVMARLARRSLIVLMTDFVDTVTAELMIENLQRLAARHLVLFVSLRDPSMATAIRAQPRNLGDVARTVVADDLLNERRRVIERLRRLGVHCLDVPSKSVGIGMLNRYLAIKERDQL